MLGYEIKNMRLIIKTYMLFYQSKANLDVKILFGKISHLLDPEIRTMLVRVLYENENSTCSFGP